MKKLVLLFVISLSILMTVRANNVKLEGTVIPLSSTGSVLTMSVDLSWDNSWRDNYNWDAVWLFFKYKVGVDGAWQHATLNASGVTVFPSDYSAMSGSTSTTVPGIFIYPSKEWGANSGKLTVQVDWQTSTTKAQMENNDVFVVAHAVEMVYIPYGAYTIGDGSSANSFCDASGKPIIIDSEAEIPLSTSSSSPVSPSAPFPKGYQGFYIMKYETSQEQYVEFLNTLTLAQQTALIPGVDALKVGEFVFGSNKTAPNYRNGVVLAAKQTGKPLKFDNNFNNNKQYSEDGDGGTLAMNYMSISDAQGYASWAGLRPLTEMEYEKACRRPFPQEPDAGEFAWNSNSGALSATGAPNGTSTETVTSGNVNAAGSTLGGPVRCGIFARSSSPSQTTSGATYWGVMEMSGNVSELCANITNTTISKTGNGTGAYNAALFGTAPTSYGTRGGGFSNIHTTLFTSDRSAVSCFTDMLQRESNVGFRCAFTYNVPSTVDAGSIVENTKPCLGTTVSLSGTPASAGGMKVTGYVWSVKINGGAYTVIAGESGVTLSYSGFEATKSYRFQRKAICPLGEAMVETKEYTIPNTVITLSPNTVMIDECGFENTVMATGKGTVYSWVYNGTSLFTGNPYIPAFSHFPSQPGVFDVVCSTTVEGCPGESKLSVTVPAITIVNDIQVSQSNCGMVSFADTRDNKVYCTTKIGNQCWMGMDLNYEPVSHWVSSHRDVFLYAWNTALTVCPAGWHLPTKDEFVKMYSSLGNQPAKVYPGLGGGEFHGVLGGNWRSSEVTYAGAVGYYWSSTANGSTYAYLLYFGNVSVDPQNYYDKTYGMSVRCLK